MYTVVGYVSGVIFVRETNFIIAMAVPPNRSRS